MIPLEIKSKQKWKEWLNRYFWPELIGLFFAYVSVLIYNSFNSPSNLASSFFATWGENFGYYSLIFYKDFKNLNYKLTIFRKIILTLKGIIFEFGMAELLDSFFFRPFCIYWGIKLLGLELGLVTGKITSDISFYIPAIIFYELKKKNLKNRKP
jgi:hypothetical protein